MNIKTVAIVLLICGAAMTTIVTCVGPGGIADAPNPNAVLEIIHDLESGKLSAGDRVSLPKPCPETGCLVGEVPFAVQWACVGERILLLYSCDSKCYAACLLVQTGRVKGTEKWYFCDTDKLAKYIDASMSRTTMQGMPGAGK